MQNFHRNEREARAVAMSIAGSDPGGGAGLQADLKTFAAFRVHGFSVITAVIAQNSRAVAAVQPVAPAMVARQIEALSAERRPDALKTGALADAAIVRAVARAIVRVKLPAPVVDPVFVSSAGVRLLEPAGERALAKTLLPLARIVTPNLHEAEALARIEIDGPEAARAAARTIFRMGPRAVLIKGGHPPRKSAPTRKLVDLLFDGRGFTEYDVRRIPGDGAHGTGCAFSAAIAASLARGMTLDEAIRAAQRYLTRALRGAYRLSAAGRPLLDHLVRP
ncbi:bifunctional hydroxymethylpyrimidine kinase/phosphomethylpyrimidine kinase [bacterium]|nr:bifunctional hydroxymethylpyrimidine kinase/phosphomethylpyrimidine kinase [bacterium]